MNSFESLIAHLKQTGVLRTESIINAFKEIDRKDFVREEFLSFAYEDGPLPIGGGQTISQPFTIAFMLELLNPQKDERVLDVGSGSGYTTALLSHLVGSAGKVVGVEIIPELVAFGKNNLSKYNFTNAEIRQAGDTLGIPEEAPYDKILVSASAEKIPEALVDQLKIGGVMVASIGNDIWRIEKEADGNLDIEKHPGFAFVPLIEK
jgi:protein-L-isoaspartate(D-aspartate) O-methyltransferase